VLKTPIFEIVRTTAGVLSIRNNVVNEIMHNPVGPWAEANALYIDQSRLKHRLQGGPSEFVLFDVGLGAAANALAALHCAKSLGGSCRPLKIVSFEKDLDLLRFALANAGSFDHFSGFEMAIESLLSKGDWCSGNLHWILHPGDFLQTLKLCPDRPHLIFFDPYSPKMNTEMWGQRCFESLRKVALEDTELFTYSQATSVRAAMIAAGFFVGYGIPTGLKEATTVAATKLEKLDRPLDLKWLERYRKSHAKYPLDGLPEDQPSIDQKIEDYFRKNL